MNKSPVIEKDSDSELESPSINAYSHSPYEAAISYVPQYVSGLNTL